MLPVNELELGDPHLLEVDRPLMLPINTHIRFIVTSLDVYIPLLSPLSV